MDIFKTHQKATYFEGIFKLISADKNWASPIDFPTVFTAYGKGIKSGNWQSCTGINTPDYVVQHYFEGKGFDKKDPMFHLWDTCKQLEQVGWEQVDNNPKYVTHLIALANTELNKLPRMT